MKSVLGLWSAHCVAYVVTFALFLNDRISKTDLFEITTTVSMLTAVILSAWLLSEQAKVLKAEACLKELAPAKRNQGTVINYSSQRLFEEEKKRIDEEFALWVETAQFAGAD